MFLYDVVALFVRELCEVTPWDPKSALAGRVGCLGLGNYSRGRTGRQNGTRSMVTQALLRVTHPQLR